MENNILEYKKYIAKLTFDLDDNIIVGRVINTKAIISFHADNITEVKQAFHDVIDTYLQVCAEERIEASKPYSGKFNLRITPDLHRELSIKAAQENLSLNDLTQEILKFGISERDYLKKISH